MALNKIGMTHMLARFTQTMDSLAMGGISERPGSVIATVPTEQTVSEPAVSYVTRELLELALSEFGKAIGMSLANEIGKVIDHLRAEMEEIKTVNDGISQSVEVQQMTSSRLAMSNRNSARKERRKKHKAKLLIQRNVLLQMRPRADLFSTEVSKSVALGSEHLGPPEVECSIIDLAAPAVVGGPSPSSRSNSCASNHSPEPTIPEQSFPCELLTYGSEKDTLNATGTCKMSAKALIYMNLASRGVPSVVIAQIPFPHLPGPPQDPHNSLAVGNSHNAQSDVGFAPFSGSSESGVDVSVQFLPLYRT